MPVEKPAKEKKSIPAFVRYYLVLFNVISAVGWSYLLGLTVIHLFNLDGKTSTTPAALEAASSAFSRFLSTIPVLKSSASSFESYIPPSLLPLYRNSTTTWDRVGGPTAIVQSLAIMEVVHVILGFVRSPLATTAMQVASRLFLVWGVLDQFPGVRSNPFFTSMILAWSITEVIRYSFYAFNLLGSEPYLLLYLRYTTFYILYPVGASSEAFVNYATLPSVSPLVAPEAWGPTDYFRAAMFAIWWPGLYVMYTYMIAQRRKVLKKGSVKQKTS